MKLKLRASLIFLLSFSGMILGQQNTFDFLRIDMSPRSAALGGSFVSNNDDADVLFYNPAGMNLLSGNPVSLSYVNYLLDINLASIAYSTEYEGIGRFGAGLKYINYGTFTGADELGNLTSDYGAGEMELLVGYANSLDENFYYGANAKFIYSSLAGYSSAAYAFDLGLHYAFPEQLINIGFSVLNMGAQMDKYIDTKEDLPLDVVIGVSKKLEHLPLKVYLDFHKLNEDQDNFGDRFKAFSAGAEVTLSRVLTLRLGYNNEKRTELKIGSFAGLAGFNLGVGALISHYQFNYGFSSMGAIGGIHRIGVSTKI